MIAAIVCTCDRHELLAGCLAALREQTLPAVHREVIVVDNSEDGEAARRFADGDIAAGIRLVRADRPGLSRARNLGVAASRAGLVAFIDDDARAAPDWLEQLAVAFADPAVAVAGGPVAPCWPGPRPAWLDRWHEGFLSVVDRGPFARDLAAGEWLAGTNVAFRRAPLLEAGGFDEALGRHPGTLLGNEELALTDRLRQAGYLVRYQPAAGVRHMIAAERVDQAWLRRRIAWQAVSDLLAAGGETASVEALWQPLGAFLGRMPPECRNLIGLTRDLDDPALARAQGEAIAAVIHLLAGHGQSLERALLAVA